MYRKSAPSAVLSALHSPCVSSTVPKAALRGSWKQAVVETAPKCAAASLSAKNAPSRLFQLFHQSRGTGVASSSMSSIAVPVLSPEGVASDVTPEGVEQEYKVHSCSRALKRELMELFPGRQAEVLNAVTLCQRTAHDMSEWGFEVNEEREALLPNFYEMGNRVAEPLRCAGYFVDYIDPSTGTPMESTCSTTLPETSDCYTQFGMEVQDLGCCRVLAHPLWGTHVMATLLVTNAPRNVLEAVIASLDE
mgnify:FL=1